MYLCVCVCIYTKSTSSLWHLANAAADVDVLDVPCGMPRILAGVAACCCCCLLLLLMSPGVVGVFLARAAIWRNVYDTTQSHATLHKETETERERERKSGWASGRGSADERLNANANDEGERRVERGELSCTQTGSHITINWCDALQRWQRKSLADS